MNREADTIYALSSGGLPSGVAVVRVSGPRALAIGHHLVGDGLGERRAALRSIRKRDGSVLDRGLVVAFPAPRSFTGEDCLELQVHGSKAVVQALFREIATFDGCRLAEAGEFSRRAFENGKLDLVEIEGLADLLAAETEMQRRLAVEQSNGSQSTLYARWREQVIRARALIEAELDFVDEGDIPGSVSEQVWMELRALMEQVAEHLSGRRGAEIIREGFKIAIVGPPNAGKSSLLNALARREIAIVTEHAGTTRDVLHCDLDLDGYSVRLYDTAGLRDTDDAVEREGVRRAQALLGHCDLVLSLYETGAVPISAHELNVSAPVLYVATKADAGKQPRPSVRSDIAISALTGVGLDRLISLVTARLEGAVDLAHLAIPTRQRHVDLLEQMQAQIAAAVDGGHLPLEVRAEHLRNAGDCLGRLTGRIDTETLLGAIFAEFCVGK